MDWKRRLEAYFKFRSNEYGGMQGQFEDIEIVAVDHPLNGLCFMANHFDSRRASTSETFIPIDTNVQDIAKALLEIYWRIHPEKKPLN